MTGNPKRENETTQVSPGIDELMFFSGEGDDLTPTAPADSEVGQCGCPELLQRYRQWLAENRQSWTTHLRILNRLGAGGQGVVYLTERRGSDGFTLPLALKIFSPERYASANAYDADMARMGRVAAKVARIQHENLLVVENFLDRDRVRMMIMEWVEGFDLRQLLTPTRFVAMQKQFSHQRWEEINNVLITDGPQQPRFKAGAAIAIVRDCLEALAAMHRHGVVHGDIKPANIMLKRSGHSKIIDIGSAFEVTDPPERRTCTPSYSAPEALAGTANTRQSDLASLGYVAIELLSGKPAFSGIQEFSELLEAKKTLVDRLPQLLPPEVSRNELLLTFLSKLIAADPKDRFLSAEDADLFEMGAAAFHRQLVKSDMASEYENDIRIWIEELLDYAPQGLQNLSDVNFCQ